eukprot:scaffold68362_cov20-Tisochrysis_lutea.AAC.2
MSNGLCACPVRLSCWQPPAVCVDEMHYRALGWSSLPHWPAPALQALQTSPAVCSYLRCTYLSYDAL